MDEITLAKATWTFCTISGALMLTLFSMTVGAIFLAGIKHFYLRAKKEKPWVDGKL